MKSIRAIAHSSGCIVLVTIHQPRFDIFNKFDSILLLAPGGVQILCEPPLKCVQKFEKFRSKTVEFGGNPADFLLDTLASFTGDDYTEWKSFLIKEDMRVKEEARLMRDSGGRSGTVSAEGSPLVATPSGLEIDMSAPVTSTSSMISSSKAVGANIFYQIGYLSIREFRNILRNPLLVLMHIVANISFGVLVGFMFRNVALDNSGVQNRLGFFFFTQAFLGFISLSALGIWREERLIIIRESLAGYYNRLSFFFVKCFQDAILLRIIPTIMYCASCYWLVNLQDGGMESYPSHFLTFTSICIGISLSTTGFCILISSLLPTESSKFFLIKPRSMLNHSHHTL